MNSKNIKQQLARLNEEIKGVMDDHDSERFVILDGAVNVDRYFSSPIRIAWLLKEAYAGVGDTGGWPYSDILDKDTVYEDFFRSHPSRVIWHPIIYVSYAIANGFLCWDQIPYLRNKPDMSQIVRSIAIINGQKLPALGGTSSRNPVIAAAVAKHINLLALQIKVLDPHILIGGNTMPYYYEALGLHPADAIQTTTLKYHLKDRRLYIDAYHPGQRSVKRPDYIDGIVSIAKHWYNTQFSGQKDQCDSGD